MKSKILYVLFFATLFSCTKDDENETPQPCNKTADGTEVKVGDKVHGGIVFYVDNSKKHGLVMPLPALLPQFKAAWWPEKAPYLIPGQFNLPTETGIGGGQANTEKLLGTSTTPYIAGICNDLVIGECYDDWYLPSIGELQELYKNLSKLPGVSLSGGYLSSNIEDVNNSGILIVNKQVSFADGSVSNRYLTDPQMQRRIDVEGSFIPVRSF